MKTNKNIAIIFTLMVLMLTFSACSNPLAKDDNTDGETATIVDDKASNEETKDTDKSGDEEKDNKLCPLFKLTDKCSDGTDWIYEEDEDGCEIPTCESGDKPELMEESDTEEAGIEDEKNDNEEKDAAAIEEEHKKTEEALKVERAQKEVVPESQIEKTMLILDASGSMWGQIDGTPKMDIAKEVLQTTVKEFDGKSELGLMAYGHREKGNCEDIEILTEPKANNSEAISNFVSAITPKGMTPMGASVLMAAENLKYTEDKATVILISDGIETCDIDLCALGKKLEETGVDFTAHVIGFDMTEEQTAGLKCLAAETGGTFTSAKDADSLSDAIGKAVESSACSAEKLGDVRLTTPPTVAAGSEFEVAHVSNGETSDNDWIAIMPKDSENTNDNLDYFRVRNDEKLTAPEEAKEYDVIYVAECGAILGRATFTVTAVSASISPIADIPAGSAFTVEFEGPNNKGDWIAIIPKGSTNNNDHLGYHYTSNTPGLTAPGDTGEYDVVYFTDDNNILARQTFIVTAVSASISPIADVPAGSDFDITFTGPDNSGDWLTIQPKGSTYSNDHLDYFYAGNNPSLRAPEDEGEYDVVYFTNDNKVLATATFKVTPVTASISPIGTVPTELDFMVEYTGPDNRGDWLIIVPTGSTDPNDHLETFWAGNNPKIEAPKDAGIYDLVYMTNGGKVLARQSFTVK